MSTHSITLHLGHVHPGVSLRHNLLRAAFLALIFGALALALVMPTNALIGEISGSEPVVAEQVLDFPTRELPPEWRWAPEPVPVEHMYSQKASQGIDWIKRPGSGRRSGY